MDKNGHGMPMNKMIDVGDMMEREEIKDSVREEAKRMNDWEKRDKVREEVRKELKSEE